MSAEKTKNQQKTYFFQNGLVQGHAYTITGIYRVELKQAEGRVAKKVHLIRVRNPWGDSNEWKGEI